MSFEGILREARIEKDNLKNYFETVSDKWKFCPKAKSTIKVYPDGYKEKEERLKELKRGNFYILKKGFIDFFTEKFDKKLYKVETYNDKKEIRVFYKNIEIIVFCFNKSSFSYSVSDKFLGVELEKIENFKVKYFPKGFSIVKGTHFDNELNYYNFNNKDLLLSLKFIKYKFATYETMENLIVYFVENCFSLFENSFFYVNRTNGDVEFFVSNLGEKLYIRDFKSIKKEIFSDNFKSYHLYMKSGYRFSITFKKDFSRLKRYKSKEYISVKREV